MPYSVCDRIVSLEPGVQGTAIKNVTFSEDYLALHFPRFPVMPAAMMIDAVACVSGQVLAACLEGRVETFLISVSGAKFRRFVRPGDQLDINVRATTRTDHDRTAVFVADVSVDGTRVASLRRIVMGWTIHA